MSSRPATLHLVCGKIAAGKSTLTAALGRRPGTIVITEDDWLARLYPGEQHTLADYVRNSSRLRSVMGPHVVALLRAGVSVVLDFPANTPASRAWMRGLFEAAGAPHQLHHLDVPDEVCKARLRMRNAEGRHAFTVTDEEFDLFTSYFVAPTADEGFNVIVQPMETQGSCVAR
ncbi:ATP-binding protein [Bradyrhizobium sp. SZCCHNRI1009]|uniref:AAA family ATPase n=1 Tax=Bradyrhizobium sp. SZCCHNRI1009 TaxID=3057277 RepID=UPI0029165F40|nr:ATP-binding protein [Bradyrhizobium sp. SZCCHNRI1009]